jgi:glycosyltransferase involved in cell wall biosynthesis
MAEEITIPARPAAGRSAERSQEQRLLLHVFPSFGIGGVPLRMCRVINHLSERFGRRFHHRIIALDGNIDAAAHLSAAAEVEIEAQSGRKRGTLLATGSGFLTAFLTLRRVRPDLLLTYNWGSIEWAIVNRALPGTPHLHLEAGFGKEEADAQLRRRVLGRRWALARCVGIVVPSRRLETIARDIWRLPAGIVTYLPNGVDIGRFAAPAHDAIPGFIRRPGELTVGTVAPLRPEKNIGRLLRAFALLDPAIPTRLLIAGDGAERGSLEKLARQLGIADRVLFAGRVLPEAVLGSFDVFALSSDTEQMPNAVLEAMAASLPIASVDVGDVKMMISPDNREFVVPRDDAALLANALGRLLREPQTRQWLGLKNRERAIAEFSQQRMFDRYADLLARGCAARSVRHELGEVRPAPGRSGS